MDLGLDAASCAALSDLSMVTQCTVIDEVVGEIIEVRRLLTRNSQVARGQRLYAYVCVKLST